MLKTNTFHLALALASVTLLVPPRPAVAQTLGSELTATCVTGVGCSQVDFFLRLTDPGASTSLDFLNLMLTGPGWMFADPNLSDASNAGGLVFADPVVSGMGANLAADFLFGAAVDPALRVRAEFAQFQPDLGSLNLSFEGGAGGMTLVSGTLSPQSVTPEPAVLLLLGTGLAGLGIVRRRTVGG